jgi:hypothetical protein
MPGFSTQPTLRKAVPGNQTTLGEDAVIGRAPDSLRVSQDGFRSSTRDHSMAAKGSG